MKKFARLEEVAGNQILAEVTCAEGDEGPKVRVRRDPGASLELTRGPWGHRDDDAAWERAYRELEELDLELLAKEMDELVNNLAKAPMEA